MVLLTSARSTLVTWVVHLVVHTWCTASARDEDKIMKACYWPNEVYEPCFGGCAEVSCDNPRSHLRPCYPYCEPGCVCEEPYVRDDRTHQCVMPQDCTPTQMGIPVPTKRVAKPPPPTPPKHSTQRMEPKPFKKHGKRDELQALEFSDVDGFKPDENKRPSELSRMGNYFNIVIAPPPIKALQPRKLVHVQGNDLGRGNSKRIM